MTQLSTNTSEPGSVLGASYRKAGIAVLTVTMLSAFEGMAVVAALPEVAADLGGVGRLPWVITSFFLASSITTIVSGPFVDSVGVDRVFRFAVVVFTVSGTAAGFVQSMPTMITLRVVQGAAGGLLIASGLAAVALIYPQRLIGRAYAAISTVWGVMSVAAPALSALMLTYLDWRWIFFINLPLGLLALWAGWNALPGPAGDSPLTIDVLGVALMAGLTTALLFAVDAIGLLTVVWLALAVVLAAAYYRHAKRHPDPVVRLEHALRQPYRSLAAGSGLMMAGAMGVHTYVPLYVRAGRNGSSAATAWSVLFLSLGWTLGANVTSRLEERISASTLCVAGFGFAVPGLLALGLLTRTDTPLGVIFAILTVIGIGLGSTTNAGLVLLRSMTEAASIGRAGSVYQFARTQGFTAGAALGGAVILLVVDGRIGDVEMVRDVLAGQSSGTLGRDVNQAVQAGYSTAALVGCVVASVGALTMMSMRRYVSRRANVLYGDHTIPPRP